MWETWPNAFAKSWQVLCWRVTSGIATTFAAVDQRQAQELYPARCFPDSAGSVASSRSMDAALARSECRGEHSRPRFAANPLPSPSACLALHNSPCSATGRPAANSQSRSTLCHSSDRSTPSEPSQLRFPLQDSRRRGLAALAQSCCYRCSPNYSHSSLCPEQLRPNCCWRRKSSPHPNSGLNWNNRDRYS
jgi:hypothetical protein